MKCLFGRRMRKQTLQKNYAYGQGHFCHFIRVRVRIAASWALVHYPTGHFANQEPKNQPIDDSKLHKIGSEMFDQTSEVQTFIKFKETSSNAGVNQSIDTIFT